MAICAACGSTNKEGRVRCDVCNAPMAPPVAGGPGGAPADDQGPSEATSAAGRDRMPGEPALPPPTTLPAYSGPTSSGSKVGIVVGVVVVGAVLVAGLALLARPTSSGSSTGTTTRPAAGPTTTLEALAGAASTTTTVKVTTTTIPGWSTYAAPDGSFRIQVPSVAQTYGPGLVGPSPGVRDLQVAAAGTDRYGYIIEYGDLAAPVPDSGMRGIAQAMAKAVGKDVSGQEQRTEVAGLPAWRYDWDTDTAQYSAVAVVDGSRVYLLWAGAASRQALSFDRFVGSFNRTAATAAPSTP